MLLFTLLQFTPLHKADVLSLFVGVFPSSIDPLVISIVDEIYGKSGTLISISAITMVRYIYLHLTPYPFMNKEE